ncbi:14030_t:CDS:1, partial [Racocetra persica]
RMNDVADMRSVINMVEEDKTKDGMKVKDNNIDNEVMMWGMNIHMNNENEEDIIKTFGDKAIQ